MALTILLAGCAAVGPSQRAVRPDSPRRPSRSTPARTISTTALPSGPTRRTPACASPSTPSTRPGPTKGLRPMSLPVRLRSPDAFPSKLFVAVDRERVDRGLAPFTGLDGRPRMPMPSRGPTAARLPPRPGPGYGSVGDRVDRRCRQRARCRLRMAVRRRPGQRRARVLRGQDRRAAGPTGSIVLGRFGSRDLVMGAAYDPTGDTSSGDRGGSSLAATLATSTRTAGRTPTHGDRPWRPRPPDSSGHCGDPLLGVRHRDQRPQAQRGARARLHAGLLRRRDRQLPACLGAALQAINHAHALEGIRPMVLPADFAQLSIPDQLFIVVNLERVDRGLPAFGGLTTALDQQCATGCGHRRRPTRPGTVL